MLDFFVVRAGIYLGIAFAPESIGAVAFVSVGLLVPEIVLALCEIVLQQTANAAEANPK